MLQLAKAVPSLPATDFSPDLLRDGIERRKLSAPAVRLFVRLADLWGLDERQRLALLGDVSRATYYNWAKGAVGPLTRDQLERVGLVLGVQKALRTLFADDAAALRWLKGVNTDLPFSGRSPLDRMTLGSVDDLYAVRRYLDAWRGVK
jgi:hypothetical protein